MKRRLAAVGTAVVLLAIACDDVSTPTGPSMRTPSARISDGRFAGGNDDFFFLPPLMPDPTGAQHYDPDGFNGKLGPTVAVCQLASNPVLVANTDCAMGPDGAPIVVASFASDQVAVTSDHYLVNWHTDGSDLVVDRFYRLQVFLGATRIGFADIDPVSSGRDLKNAVTGQTITLLDGRTLPVKFRIENGVLCTNKADCGEFKVTNEGGTFISNTKDAAIQFKPGFLPAGVEEITLTIERVNVGPDNRCHGAASARLWVEFEGCYEMTSDPDLRPYGGIQQPAIAGQCVEVSITDPLYDFLQPYKSHNGGELQRLASAPAPFLDCEGFEGTTASASRRHPIMRYALTGLDRVGKGFGKVFGVRTANAIDLGLGEELPIGSALSRFSWAVGLEAERGRGDEQVVGFGLAAPLPLELHVRSLHFHVHTGDDDVDDEHPEDVPGVPVQFSVTAGDGYFLLEEGEPVRTIEVLTTADGLASVPFTAASNSDANVITAHAPTLDAERELTTFAIAGLPPDLEVSDLTRNVAVPTSADALSWSFDVTNVGEGAAIPSLARLVVTYDGEGTETVASFDIAVPRLAPGASVSLATPPLAAPRDVGDYDVIVMANANGGVTEADDENNTESEAFSVIDVLGHITGLVWAGEGTEQTLPGTQLELLGPTGGVIASDIANDVTSIFRFRDLTPGTYSVRATNVNFQPRTLPVQVVSGQETVLDFHLDPFTGLLSGTVMESSTGTPLAGVLVSIDGFARSAVTSTTGRYVIANAPPGTHAVRASLVNFGVALTNATIGTGETVTDFALQSLSPWIAPSPAAPQTIIATRGGTAVQRTITINNGGGGAWAPASVSVQFTYPPALVCDTCLPPVIVGVTLDNTVTPAVVTISALVDETFPLGDYSFSFTISASGAANGPVNYPFAVRVVDPLPGPIDSGGGCGPLGCVAIPPQP